MNSWDPNAPRAPQADTAAWKVRGLTAVDDDMFLPTGGPQVRLLAFVGKMRSAAFALGALLIGAAIYLLMQPTGTTIVKLPAETLTLVFAGLATVLVLLAALGVRARPLESVDDVQQVLGVRVAVIERGTDSDVR